MLLRRMLLIASCLFIAWIIFSTFNAEDPSFISPLDDNKIIVEEEKTQPKRYYNYPDKISLDNVERKTSLKAKKTFNEIFFKDKHIVALGDSLTEGIGDAFSRGGYLAVLDRTINEEEVVATFSNYGKLGEKTTDLLRRLRSYTIQESIKQADFVIMTIGANDIIKVVSENFADLSYELFLEEQERFEKRLIAILEEIRSLNEQAHIYLVGLYNPIELLLGDIKEFDQIVNEWNESSERVAEEWDKVTYVPVKDIFSSNSHLFAEDHFHPNSEGYVKIAERLLDYLTFKEGVTDE